MSTPTQLFWGPYPFLPGAIWFTINKRPIIGRTGRRNFVEETWFINGRVQGTTPAEVIDQVALLEAGLDLDNQNLVFSLYHQLLNADCIEGTHIRDFKWLTGYDGVRGSGAELVLRRTFHLIVSGTKVVTSDTDIIEYSETVSGYGTGLPSVVEAGSLFGLPQPQSAQAKTSFHSWQRGYCKGLTATPSAASPIWIGNPNVFYVPTTLGGGISTPERWGVNQNTGFKIDWSYRAWSPTVAMVASPLPI